MEFSPAVAVRPVGAGGVAGGEVRSSSPQPASPPATSRTAAEARKKRLESTINFLMGRRVRVLVIQRCANQQFGLYGSATEKSRSRHSHGCQLAPRERTRPALYRLRRMPPWVTR